MQSDEIKNLLHDLSTIRWAFGVCATCISVAFGALILYIRATRKTGEDDKNSIGKEIKATYDNLAQDIEKMAVDHARLWDIARKNENNITGLTGDIKRIDQKCELLCKKHERL